VNQPRKFKGKIEVFGDFFYRDGKMKHLSPKQQLNNAEPGHADGLL